MRLLVSLGGTGYANLHYSKNCHPYSAQFSPMSIFKRSHVFLAKSENSGCSTKARSYFGIASRISHTKRSGSVCLWGSKVVCFLVVPLFDSLLASGQN